MSKSARLRAEDSCAISVLVGECRELGDDSAEWRRHLLAGIAGLVGTSVAVEYETVLEPSRPFQPSGTIDWGWENGEFNREAWVRVIEEFGRRGLGFNAMVPAYVAATRAGRGPCLTRSDVLPDSLWYRSRYYTGAQRVFLSLVK